MSKTGWTMEYAPGVGAVGRGVSAAGLAIVLSLGGLGVAACRREVDEPAVAPSAAAIGASPAALGSAAALGHGGAGGAPPTSPGSPHGMPMAGGAHGGDPMGAVDPSKVIAGTIDIAPKLKGQAKSGETLFVVARSWTGKATPGGVVAVQRYTVASLPQPFELSGANTMIMGTKFEGQVSVSVRLDRDGDAMTKNPGDLEGTVGPIEIPKQGVKLVLDTVRQ